MEFDRGKNIGRMLRSGLQRIGERIVAPEVAPTSEFSDFISSLSQGTLEEGDPFYGILPGGILEGMTYKRNPDGSESAYYDVVLQRTNTKMAFPIEKSAEGEFTVGKPIAIDLRES